MYSKLQKIVILLYVLTLCALAISPLLVLGALLEVLFYGKVTYYEPNKLILGLEIVIFLIASVYGVKFYITKISELKRSLSKEGKRLKLGVLPYETKGRV